MDSFAQAAHAVREALPPGGLFADQHWRISPAPFPLGPKVGEEIESLGRVLLQFYRAVNQLYRQSLAGKQPGWIAQLLDQGKPRELLGFQVAAAFRNELPRVIRPDILLTDGGWAITELDNVPGGIGLTGWLNRTYGALPPLPALAGVPANDGSSPGARPRLVGTGTSMLEGFASIFGQAPQVHIVVSEEAASYRPEMEWLAAQLGNDRFHVQGPAFGYPQPGEAVYRFFELFDLASVPGAARLLDLAAREQIRLTPPPKPIFEEKLVFALLWNRNLREFWRRELGEAFFRRLLRHVPYSWVVDPAPLPPHAAIPELNLTDWQQLKLLSQRERELVLKVSGYSEQAWGARGVYVGSDLSREEWSAAVDKALAGFGSSPYLLQRYHKPALLPAAYYDFDKEELVNMPGRVRLCPYYFVTGEGDAAKATLGGVLATICPANKKIIHGMTDAILAPASVG
jgi:hypothetical protein